MKLPNQIKSPRTKRNTQNYLDGNVFPSATFRNRRNKRFRYKTLSPFNSAGLDMIAPPEENIVCTDPDKEGNCVCIATNGYWADWINENCIGFVAPLTEELSVGTHCCKL